MNIERGNKSLWPLIDTLRNQVGNLICENAELRRKYERPVTMPPKNFEGWTVQTAQDGYIRLYRRVNGKVTSIYIGRAWDADKARAKILRRMKVSS